MDCSGKCLAAKEFDQKYDALLAKMKVERSVPMLLHYNDQLQAMDDAGAECSCEDEAEDSLGEFGYV